jgi:hypothetical protein
MTGLEKPIGPHTTLSRRRRVSASEDLNDEKSDRWSRHSVASSIRQTLPADIANRLRKKCPRIVIIGPVLRIIAWTHYTSWP